ncbi:DUF6304 family protein [Streptomyces sp. BE308]|uniref:DUF6304 family protein n=1 Tax=unclassified Streptomyces TaxID=2593676 RepID=UPI00093CF616|nr:MULTISPECIES: DUF6304 family protein [unclassified Streptomyces]MCX4674367.1 DUF6304 family protein [Streptomyces sp. NBC_01433]MEE1796954.1 DUF6304 family protein [Streptomyces sp. BE308]OKI47602.1 hypothetical protein A6A29_00455 [Streptomyces sp. TSRI0281]WRZ75003.1 DUF6304 family protein [Streptomyces sp. NBC_01237]
MTDESWAGWYRDREGSDAVVLTTDGQQLRIRIRGVDFEGESFDDLVPVGGIPPESGMFALADGALTDCVLEWDLPLPVRSAGTVRQATLSCLLSLRRSDPDLYLALHLDGAVYESARAERDFAAAMATIQRILPSGTQVQTCIACAFSDYFPAPGRGLSGALACFRGAKDAYRGAAGEDDVLDLWDRRSGFVQEIWSCREFEARPAEGAGTGHRGAFPLELA